MKEWTWFQSGLALAASFLLAVILVKPIGVSTQFVILDGVIANAINPELVQENPEAKSGYESPNAYLNKSGGKYAKSIAKPINYGFVFVIAMVGGGLISRLTRKDKSLDQIPIAHTRRFGSNIWLRYVLTFIGGAIVLWGARLAGGCTSGHMMSGMMQTAVSGYLFAAAAFVVAIPTALLVYKRKSSEDV
ncbi:YeeE/YedE family protein [Sulfuriroseicoccus oceanibius]|uniref:YeeE/YedE family protein n=1 Tax=Sulfuriroseicoccus oceanibius TaxID=2707525 RepID=A0A6B3LDG4_9BACT|nr:YeeE/YedE family protein [Sulfuriroseicoccus oceanibius]